MIDFAFEHKDIIPSLTNHETWLRRLASHHNAEISDIAYIFCSDNRLLKLNQTYLKHDYYTDILTFDRTEGKILSGDIYISLDRVQENANKYEVSFEEELRRVMAHGILHMLGIDDKTERGRQKMNSAENKALELFHVKQ